MTVQGFLASITFDAINITTVVENLTLGESRVSLDKQTMNGSPDGVMLPGAKSGSLAFEMTINQAELNIVEAAWAKDDGINFVIAIVEDGVTTNTLWSGVLAFNSFSRNTVGDGLWRASVAGDTSGSIVHVPYVP